MSDIDKIKISTAIRGIYNLHMTGFVLAILYFGQTMLVPLALAIILTLLLTPPVKYLLY